VKVLVEYIRTSKCIVIPLVWIKQIMKHILTFWGILLQSFCFAQTPATDPCWGSPVWNDQFKTMSKTLGSWCYEIGGKWAVPDDWARTDEIAVFTEENVYIDTAQGMIITARKEAGVYSCTPCTNDAPYYYTAGSVSSLDAARKIKYGYLEAKIKTSDVYGLWPSFWTWEQVGTTHTDSNWDYDEIDIFEMTPGCKESCDAYPGIFNNTYRNRNVMTSNIHNNLNGHELGCTGLEDDRGRTTYVNDYTAFHVYGLEWSPSKLLFYVDGLLVRNAPNPGYPVDLQGNISQQANIILSLGISHFVAWDDSLYYDADNVNATDYFNVPGHYSSWNSTSLNSGVPEEMVVEYIKYYLLDDSGCDVTDLTMTSGNIGSYDNKVKRDMTTSGTISIPSGYSHPSWRAASSIIISGDFTVPLGSELYLDVNPCY
jgi:beta-glucanase (GH16 family)